MEVHVFALPVPHNTLSRVSQTYAIEVDISNILKSGNKHVSNEMIHKRRLKYHLFINDPNQTSYEGSIIGSDQIFIITIPFSGNLPVCFIQLNLASKVKHKFNTIYRQQRFIQIASTANVYMTIGRHPSVCHASDLNDGYLEDEQDLEQDPDTHSQEEEADDDDDTHSQEECDQQEDEEKMCQLYTLNCLKTEATDTCSIDNDEDENDEDENDEDDDDEEDLNNDCDENEDDSENIDNSDDEDDDNAVNEEEDEETISNIDGDDTENDDEKAVGGSTNLMQPLQQKTNMDTESTVVEINCPREPLSHDTHPRIKPRCFLTEDVHQDLFNVSRKP